MGDEMPSLVVWVPAASVRLKSLGSEEAPNTCERRKGRSGAVA